MRIRRIWTAAMLASALLVDLADASELDVDMLLVEAVEVYATALDATDRELRLENFRRAERLFAAAARRGRPSADLYANLGNAALQAENLGTAVIAYRRALLLNPDHVRAAQNLEHVRGLAPDWVPRREATSALEDFFFWHRTLSREERSVAAALCFALAGGLLAGGVALRSRVMRNFTVLPVVGWLALLASVASDPANRSDAEAVVTAPEAVARSADSLHAPARFSQPLPTGTEVVILEDRGDWLRVALANRREAWLRASSLTRVRTGTER